MRKEGKNNTAPAKGTEKNAAVVAFRHWGVFLGIALGALLLLILPAVAQGKYLVWGYGDADGTTQHATFLEYMFRNGIFGGLGGYDYSSGLGADYAVSFAYYMLFDPLNFLLYLLPRGNFLLAYSVLGVVRLLLCAVCAYIYLGAHKVRQRYRVLFSVAYMLSGYMVFTFLRHPDLTSGAMYLPLLTLGIERCVRRNRPWLMIASVFVITISSFYMAYMVTLYAVLYAIVVYVKNVHTKGEKVVPRKFAAAFFRTAGCYLIGLLLASFMLFPVAHGYLSASRSAGKGMHVYSVRDLFFFAGSFFVPTPGGKYTFIMFNACTLLLAFGAFAARVRSPHKIMTVVFAAGIFVPVVGYVMNLCNYVSNRYSYMLSWSVCALLAEYADTREAELPTPRESNAMVKGIFTAVLGTLNLAVWTAALFSLDFVPHFAGAIFTTLAVAASVGSVVGLRKFYARDYGTETVRRRLGFRRVTAGLAALTLCGAIVFCGIYSGQFDDGSNYKSLSSAAERYVGELDRNEFIRLDTTVVWHQNRPVNSGYRGTVAYNTLLPAATADFLRAHNIYTFSPSLGMSGLGNRTALEALLGAKYYRAQEGAYVPAQYAPHGEVEELYETDAYLRFGTVYGETETISPLSWERIEEQERQYAALDAVLVDDGRDWTDEEIDAALLGTAQEIATEDFTLYRETEEIGYPDFAGQEVYLRFSVDIPEEFGGVFEVHSGGAVVTLRVMPRGEQMYTGQTEFLLKLDETAECVRFVPKSGGKLRVHDLRFFTVPMDAVLRKVAFAAARPHLTDTTITSTRIEGKIESEGGYMRIPLAYASGWSATVDGVPTPVLAADAGLMAIRIEAGAHTVVLSYDTPWRKIGLLGTLAAAGALVGLGIGCVAVYAFRRKKQQNGAIQ